MQKDGEPRETRDILLNLPRTGDSLSAMIQFLMVGMRSTAPSKDLTGGASVTLQDMAEIIREATEGMEAEE